MLKNDYIMRKIEEWISMILEFVFKMLKHKTQDSLLIGLLFYSYLNEKDSKFLNEHDFERDEIKTGIKDLLNEFNMNNLSDLI